MDYIFPIYSDIYAITHHLPAKWYWHFSKKKGKTKEREEILVYPSLEILWTFVMSLINKMWKIYHSDLQVIKFDVA